MVSIYTHLFVQTSEESMWLYYEYKEHMTCEKHHWNILSMKKMRHYKPAKKQKLRVAIL